MYFKRIEIHGFKSFAEPTVIEFDRGITCVVGPNGSGKSNICDAIRWVLGAQSAKVLRGDKMEDVIFAGTAARKSRGMAEVTLVIDNSEGELDIEYNEVAITRRMYRSGESEYLINNTQCRMRDIRELIMDTGIGVEGYSIIGQGKISDIISNNTESIREILEETAGIVMYRSRKADAERKLSSATANMERVGDIIGEIEGRIDKLRDDSEKATRYLELRDRHKELEINITLKNIDSIKEKNKDVEADLANLKKEIEEVGTKRDALADEISKGLAAREELDEKIEAKRSEQTLVSGELARLVNQREVNSERLSAIERNDERLRAEIKDLERKIEVQQQDSKELFEEKEQWDSRLAEKQSELEEKLAAFRKNQEELHEEGNLIDEKKNDLMDLQSKVTSKKAEISSMESLKETLEKRRAQVESEKDSGEEGNRSSVDSLEEAQKEKEMITRELEDIKKQRDEARVRLVRDTESEREVTQALEEIKISIGQKQARKRTFEEMQHNYEGYNHAVKFIMKEKQAGIRGTVAELIDVPKGYEVAMETAFAGTIQNIICDSDDVAKAAIAKLKAERAGRLTFLPLGSIKSRGVKTDSIIEESEGFKGYAVDRLSFEDEYRTAIEYLIGNVVVMQDIDSAIRLSKKIGGGYKLVTLEGELITAGGSITGGRHKNKSANIFERKAEVNDLAEQLDQLEKEQAEKESDIVRLRKQIEEEQSSISENELAVTEKERQLFAKENEITIINTAITDFASSSERWEKELANIIAEESSADKTISRLEEEAAQAAEEISRIETSLEEKTSRYEEKSSALEEQNRQITEARIEAGSCENEKAKVDAIVERVQDAIARFREDMQAKTSELEQMQREKEQISGTHDENAGIIEEKKKFKEELDQILTELFANRKEVTAKSAEDNRVKDELDRNALALSNQKNELDIKQARQETQLENARNKLWDEFEISYAQALDYAREDFVMSAAVKENRQIKNELRELGEVNVGAIEEYKEVSERYEFLTGQRSDIEQSMNELTKIISDMDRIIKEKFKESFDSVVMNFEEVFRELYGGGHAKISLADEADPFNSEIEITAQPPGKQLKHINLLSGGEKTMTAIALMFAVLKTKPTPCCILDEIEAALDDSNLDIFGKYVRRFEGVQFTLITHQKQTMEHADVMYGITMPESGVSKVYSLKMDDQTA